jgi:hypothetical protein
VVWCQNVSKNIADKAGFLAGVYRVLKPGGLFTATECSVGPGGDIIFPVPWAYDVSINSLEPADVMRTQYHMASFRILEWMNYSNNAIEHYERMLSAPPKLTGRLIFGDDAPERQRNSQQPDRRADHLLDDHGGAPQVVASAKSARFITA